MDASQRGNMGSTCSHSCDANCTSAVVARNGELVIVLTTVSNKIEYLSNIIYSLFNFRTDMYTMAKSCAWIIFRLLLQKLNGERLFACADLFVVEDHFFI